MNANVINLRKTGFRYLSQDINESNSWFYVVDTINKDTKGPLSESEFEEMLDVLKVNNLSQWIHTKAKPEGAKLP